MTLLEEIRAELAPIIAKVEALQERADRDAVAESFLRGTHEIREGDCVQFECGHAAQITNISSDGKWTYTDRQGRRIEPFRVPPEDGIKRLYTIAEVADIIAKARKL